MTKLNKETLEYFLSEDFTNWLLTSLSNMEFSNNTQEKLYTFYTIIDHYIELKDIKGENIKDNEHSMAKGYFIKYYDTYGRFVDEYYESELDDSMKHRIYLEKIDINMAMGKEVIDMEYLTGYVMDLLCQIKDIDVQKQLMTTIERLKQNGVEVKEILDNLQIAYATLANEEIRRR